MTVPFRSACLLLLSLLVISCSKSSDKSGSGGSSPAVAPAPGIDRQGALLQPGYAAVLVAFPEPRVKGEWLSLVSLQGTNDTDKLPRIPLAVTYATTVLNIPPGEYTVSAKAWVRKYPVYAGGVSGIITVKAGELFVLSADYIGDPLGNVEQSALRSVGRQNWALTTPGDLTKYITQVSNDARG